MKGLAVIVYKKKIQVAEVEDDIWRKLQNWLMQTKDLDSSSL